MNRLKVKEPWTLVLLMFLLCPGFAFIMPGSGYAGDDPAPKAAAPSSNAPPGSAVVSIARAKTWKTNMSDADYIETTRRAIQLAGGFEGVIKKGDTVLIKPNIVGPSPSGAGRITDYRVVQAIVDMAKEAGAARVVVAEGPVDCGFEEGVLIAGYRKIKGAELLNLNMKQGDCYLLRARNPLTGVSLYLPKIYVDADVVIDVPVLKTHSEAGVTLCLKNTGIGVPPQEIYARGGRGSKVRLHEYGINNSIVDVNAIRKPDFCVIDGMIGGEGNGPVYPTPIKLGLVIAGRDIVAVDTVGTMVMGFRPYEIAHIVYAAAHGLGTMDPRKIKVVGESIESVKADFAPPPTRPYVPTTVIRELPNSINILIDGNLSEWSAAWMNYVGERFQVIEGKDLWQGQKDASLEVGVMHDGKTLFLAADVRDDIFLAGEDSLDVYLAFGGPRAPGFRTSGHESGYFFRPFVFLKVRTQSAAGGALRAEIIDYRTQEPVEGSNAAIKTNATGYTLEAAIPLTSIGVISPLPLRDEIWVDFLLKDEDSEGSATKLSWAGRGDARLTADTKLMGRGLIDSAQAH